MANGALVAKSDKLNKIVEPFTHGGGMIHDPSEFRFAQVFEQIGAANYFPKLLEGVKGQCFDANLN